MELESGDDLDADDAVVLRGHSGEVGRRRPARAEPFQICVGRPTGDSAALSDVDGNLVVAELLEELARRRNPEAFDSLGRVALNELDCITRERDRALLFCFDRAV